MTNQYVTQTHDEFKNTTVTRSYELTYSLPPRKPTLQEDAIFNIRHVTLGTTSVLCIDVHFASAEIDVQGIYYGAKYSTKAAVSNALSTYPGEWAFLREGNLVIKTDAETFTLKANALDSDVTKQSFTNAMNCEEICYYRINQDILYKICEGQNVRLQLNGGRASWTLKGEDFVLMAKAFYNGFYDSSKYNNELQHAQSVSDKKAQIKKKGCIIEVILAVVFCILAQYQDKWDDDVSATIAAILLLSIIAVAIVRRVMANKVQ